ncbi:MAG: lysophospholipid acyltransferase family protein [Bacteroidia bacterium]
MIIFSFLLYYLIVIPISYLPLRVLYAISDFLYVVIWYAVPYRKPVVMQNLRNSFPGKSEGEIKAIAKKFYHHFCDVVVETLKSFTASRAFIEKHIVVQNADLLQHYYKQGKSIIGITSHYANWEWGAQIFSCHSDHVDFGIYAPLQNKFWNEKVKQSRKRFELNLVAVADVPQCFEDNEGRPAMYGFIADQTPSNVNRCHWMQFLNQDTPVFFGPEKYAKKYNYVVLYANIQKLKRGSYTLRYDLVCDDPSVQPHAWITETHTRMLEKNIIEAPEYWLWTHRRWKRKRPAEMKEQEARDN